MKSKPGKEEKEYRLKHLKEDANQAIIIVSIAICIYLNVKVSSIP